MSPLPLPGEKDYLFVYGTLRKCPDSRCQHNHRMYHVLAQYADFAGKGTMRGRLFNVGEYPGAVLSTSAHEVIHKDMHDVVKGIVHDTVHDGVHNTAHDVVGDIVHDVVNGIVHGELYALRDRDHILRVLDEYEGCGPDDPQPTEFRRGRTTVFLETGQEVRAWVYLYNRPTRGAELIPSGNYLS